VEVLDERVAPALGLDHLFVEALGDVPIAHLVDAPFQGAPLLAEAFHLLDAGEAVVVQRLDDRPPVVEFRAPREVVKEEEEFPRTGLGSS